MTNKYQIDYMFMSVKGSSIITAPTKAKAMWFFIKHNKDFLKGACDYLRITEVKDL